MNPNHCKAYLLQTLYALNINALHKIIQTFSAGYPQGKYIGQLCVSTQLHTLPGSINQ